MLLAGKTRRRMTIDAIAEFLANAPYSFGTAIYDTDVDEYLFHFQLGQRCPNRASHLFALRMLGDPIFNPIKDRLKIEWLR